MSHVTIDFETLKFNLYEVLGIDINASDTKIKKAFKNLILNFHPDKNNSAEEEIYYHIITANQVLTNTEHRKKYNEFLNKLQDTHDDLKNKFIKITKNTEGEVNNLETKENAKKEFNNKFNELEQKHLTYFNENNKTMDAYNKLLKQRDEVINIPKEDIKSVNDFNEKFENRILCGDYFNDQIIPSTEKMELSTINVNDNYTSLDIAFNNLYIDGGGVNTSKFSSLDSAFKIQPISTKNFKEVNIKDAIDSYNNELKMLIPPKKL
jgi:curved DNA-binding protein CbpA